MYLVKVAVTTPSEILPIAPLSVIVLFPSVLTVTRGVLEPPDTETISPI